MAKSKQNDMVKGLSGRVGKMISYRNIGDDTEAFRRPGKRETPSTPGQLTHRERFLESTYYGKGVMADPVKRAQYEGKVTKRKSVYNLAVADFMKGPEVKFIDKNNYNGLAGDTILVRAIDNFLVASVKVAITAANGTLIEQGGAVLQPTGADWVYTCTVANPQLAGTKITVVATDLPANKATLEIVV